MQSRPETIHTYEVFSTLWFRCAPWLLFNASLNGLVVAGHFIGTV